MTLDNIKEEIDKAEKIVILTHENPDGDAIGSGLAMYNALKEYGKNPDIIIPEYSRIFKFLPGTDEIKTESDIEQYDLAISLDCATIKDVLEGNQTAISHQEAREIVNKYFEELETKMNAANIEQGKAFLEENKKRPNVVTLPSGLQYEVITEGTGKKAQAVDGVFVAYGSVPQSELIKNLVLLRWTVLSS